MKILYSVQATGNGHISRAMELLPFLKQYGEIDLFLSGANSTLPLDAPVKYRSKGVSLFYTCDGQLSYRKMLRHIHPLTLMKEVRDLPVEKYDLVLNDFECITALACARKKIPSVNFGHQASFMSAKTPRPEKKSAVGEWILKNYARANRYIGLHFQSYDTDIFSPVIKSEILRAQPKNLGHITVYLPSYCDEQLAAFFSNYAGVRFEIFSHQKKEKTVQQNLSFLPVSKTLFNESMINCDGLITGGGFETPAEALYLKKKIISIPINGQYEQQCNAAALKKLGIPVYQKLDDDDFRNGFMGWLNDTDQPQVNYDHSTEKIVNQVILKCANLKNELDLTYPELIFN